MSMTNLGAPLRLGSARGAAFAGGAPGAENSVHYAYNVIPLTLQDNNYSVSASPGAAALTLAAGTGTTAVTFGGQSCIKADVPRNVRITSGSDDSGISFTVSGFDQYGAAMTETITGAAIGIASGKKAFLYVWKILPSGAAAGTVKAGTGDVFGLPYQVLDLNYLGPKWAEAMAADAGTGVKADTATATATTGDVRGTYAPSSASNGTRRLTVNMLVLNVDTLQGAASLYGMPQA